MKELGKIAARNLAKSKKGITQEISKKAGRKEARTRE